MITRSYILLLMLFIAFPLSSCSTAGVNPHFKDWLQQDVLSSLNLWKPRPWGLADAPEGGPPEFTQGWKDGCESGLAGYGGNHYRNLGYKFKQDISMINNSEYYRAWQDGYGYCRWYIWNYMKGGSINIFGLDI